LARFRRIALVMSGGAALGAYQAGACAALEGCGVRPNWIAATAIGAVNAAIVAGSLPHERAARLRRFWEELTHRAGGVSGIWARASLGRLFARREAARAAAEAPPIAAAELRELIGRSVDFDRINSGAVRVVLGALSLTTGAETFFDNDRHVLGLDHVMASLPLPGLPPVAIGGQVYGGSAAPVWALEDARPADTLCVAIDGYDPAPGKERGISRSAREIAALRRNYDLRRMIALLGERLPPAAQSDLEVRKCLAAATNATMTILHLVHEGNGTDLAVKMTDFSAVGMARRWQAGEADVKTSFAQPLWLAPPPRVSGVVVHEVRGGIAAPPR
jgi:NTE family protein